MYNTNTGMVHRGKILLCNVFRTLYFHIVHIRRKIHIVSSITAICPIWFICYGRKMINVCKQTADLITHINVDIRKTFKSLLFLGKDFLLKLTYILDFHAPYPFDVSLKITVLLLHAPTLQF